MIVIKDNNRLILFLTIAVAFINLISLIFNRKDKILLFSYTIAILSSCFYYFDFPYISIIYILASFIIMIQVLRDNMLYPNNVLFIAIVGVVIVAIGLVGINIVTYKDKVEEIVNKENKGYIQYETDYFKNISVLGEDSEFYLNVKRNNKWGYIDKNGNIKIDFEYDYASPFITINEFDKNFDIALVCKDDASYIILKNKRTVMSFKNEISIDDYQGQLDKLQLLYNETFKQEGTIGEQFSKVPTSNINYIPSYEKSPYRYPFNDEYDIYITVSQTGGINRYEFMKKGNSNIKVSIDCDNLKFDGSHLYIYSNGNLPFYKVSEKMQGWYDKETRRIEIPGNIQILEFYENSILIKNFDDNTVYFLNTDYERISDIYRDIFVLDDAYIVKNLNNKYIIINKNFEKILDIEYDYINPILLDEGLLICANLPARVNFNSFGFPSNLEYDIVDLTGKKITLKNTDGSEIENPGYSGIYSLYNKKTVSSYDLYINNLTDIFYEFIGEEFYKK